MSILIKADEAAPVLSPCPLILQPLPGTAIKVSVILSGRLKIDGYGLDHPVNGDGSYHLEVKEGDRVQEVPRRMGIPGDQVAMVMVNGRTGSMGETLREGDRVVLIPSDVALMWRFLGRQNLGMGGILDR